MSQVLIQIQDQGDEVHVQVAIDPPLTEDKTVFSTAEIIGLYMREHMADLLKAAVLWTKEPEPAPVEEPAIKAPKLILPDDITGAPV